jgi:hypothetical protein
MEDPMLKMLALAAVVAAVGTPGAMAAEYYVAQEKATKKCKVVETRPSATETTWVQVGPLAFKTRDEAEKQITVICKEKMN